MGNPFRNVEVITKKFWKERNGLQTGNFIFVVVGAVDEVFFFYRKEENGKWTKFEPLASVLLSFVVFSLFLFVIFLSFSLSLSLSLSLSPSLSSPYTIFLLSKRERGGGLDTIDDAKLLTSCAVCVGGGGGRGVCVSDSFLSFLFFAMWKEREIMLSWFLFFGLKKRSCQSLRDLACTVPSYNIFLFFFQSVPLSMVCLSTKMVLNTGGASRAGSTQRQTSLYHVTTRSFTAPNLGWSSGGWSPGHWPNFGAVKVKVVKQMKSEFVFVFFFFFTFGHNVSVRDDGLGQNDQFIFTASCVFLCNNETILSHCSSFHSGTPVCHGPLAKGSVVCVLQCHIYMQDISNASLHVHMRFDTSWLPTRWQIKTSWGPKRMPSSPPD